MLRVLSLASWGNSLSHYYDFRIFKCLLTASYIYFWVINNMSCIIGVLLAGTKGADSEIFEVRWTLLVDLCEPSERLIEVEAH